MRDVTRERIREAVASELACTCSRLLNDGSHFTDCPTVEIDYVTDAVWDALLPWRRAPQ